MARGSDSNESQESLKTPSGPWTDLGLTLPIFVGYHLGVIYMPVRNAADMVTQELVALSENSLASYVSLTLGIGIAFVSILVMLGRGKALRWERFVLIGLEGVVYAVAMCLAAGYVVGRVFLGMGAEERLTGLVMSLGAGFYEELVFRVGLFGLGARVLPLLLGMVFTLNALLFKLVWAVVAAAAFSGWHHLGQLGEAFEPQTFVFRWVCGLVFTLIFVFRGFAPAVWTHTIYDIWVMVL